MKASQASRCRERVEFLLEPFRSAGGSRQPAALRLSIASPVGYAGCEDRRVAGRFGFNPKKSGPDHAVPAVGTTGFLGSTQHDQCRRRGRLAGWNKSVNRQGGSSTWIGSTLHNKINAHCGSYVLSRAIPCSDRAQQRHKIIRKTVALLGDESVSVVTVGTAPTQTGDPTHACLHHWQ